MNTLKIIEGQVQEIPFPVWHQVCDAFFQDKDSNSAYNLIKDWHKQSIIQILQSEIERKRGMKKEYTESFHVDEVEKNQAVKYKNHGEVGFNRCLKEDIAHLQNLLDNLK